MARRKKAVLKELVFECGCGREVKVSARDVLFSAWEDGSRAGEIDVSYDCRKCGKEVEVLLAGW